VNEWKIKQDICEVGRRLYERQFVAANDGNISVRVGDNEVLCTPTLTSKGFLVPDDICKVNMEGKQIGGRKRATSEIKLHLAIMREEPKVKAVVHAHPAHATAFAVAGVSIPQCVLPEVEVFLSEVPILRYETPGTWDFAETVVPYVKKTNTALLANHGAVTWSGDVLDAYFKMEIIDAYCRILILARQLGRVNFIEEEKIPPLLDIKKRLGVPDPRVGCENCAVCPTHEWATSIGYAEPLRADPAAACPHGRRSDECTSCAQREPIAARASAAAPELPPEDVERLVATLTDQVMAALG